MKKAKNNTSKYVAIKCISFEIMQNNVIVMLNSRKDDLKYVAKRPRRQGR
jgi:hypothetical protein